MRLFDRSRISASGLSVIELTILGSFAAASWLLGFCLLSAVRSRAVWPAVAEWDNLREAVGMLVGVPLFGAIASKLPKLGLPGQLFAIAFALGGGGALLVLAVELLIRVFL